MKPDILLGITLSLTKNTCVHAKTLAQDFCCSVRTIYRYISVLDTFIPIVSKVGKNGGFSIMYSLSTCSIPLTIDERMYLGKMLLDVLPDCKMTTLKIKLKHYITDILHIAT